MKKPCFDCGVPVQGNTMCAECLSKRQPQRRERADRPSRQARGYDAEYEHNRAVMVEVTRQLNLPCVICGHYFEPGETITAEHLIPLRRGGTNDLDNLGPACGSCNSGWARGRRRQTPSVRR
jgi:hypothetical protein